jgi:heme A synthase
MGIIENNIVYIFAIVGIVLLVIFFAFWITNGSASKYPIVTTTILVVFAAIIGAYMIYKFTGGLSIAEALRLHLR